MTEDKARKRAVRARMTKTGERYTSARRHVVAPAEAPRLPSKGPRSMPPRVADPGMPEESVLKGTGCTWDRWLAHLDRWGAREKTHTEIARHLAESFDISGWWAQTVTVGYERARGMRAKHQTTKGFAVSTSKTLPVSVEAVWPFVADPTARSRWVPAGTLRQRKLLPMRNARFDGPEGALVIVWLDAKGEAKTTVGVQVEKLPDGDSVEPVRAFWKERLARLAATVG